MNSVTTSALLALGYSLSLAGCGGGNTASSLPVVSAQGSQIHSFGLIRSNPADIARLPQIRRTESAAVLPTIVDLSPRFPAVGDQGNEGSCVAWATAYAMRGYEARQDVWSTIAPQTTSPSYNFSPSFVYNSLNNGRDNGLQIISAFNFMVSKGAATLADMPYVAGQFKTVPSAAAFADALNYKIASYGSIAPTDLTTMKTQLSKGIPVVLGISVYGQFYNLQSGQTVTSVSGNSMGGHAITVVGYNDTKQAIEIINSWSTYWGSAGYGWIAYNVLPSIVNEAYSAIDGLAPVPVSSPTPTPTVKPTPTPVPTIKPTPTPVPTVKPTPTPVASGPNIYVAAGSVVKIYNSFGLSATSIANGSLSGFANAAAVAVDSAGNIYVADSSANSIRVFTHTGAQLFTILGLNKPTGVAVSSAGNIFVANSGANNVKVYTSTGAVATAFASGTLSGAAAGMLSSPHGIAVDSIGKIYVANSSGSDNVNIYTSNGALSSLLNFAKFVPTAVAVDATGNVFTASSSAGAVVAIGSNVAPSVVGWQIRLAGADGIAVDAADNVYVSSGTSVKIYTKAGAVATAIAGGSITVSNTINGIAIH